MRRKLEIEMQAGIFLFLGLLVAMFTVLMMGGESLFEKTYKVYIEVSDTAGLAKGSLVRSGGVKIGVIDEIKFSENYENVRIALKINEGARQRIREDSMVRFQTQGVLGDKYIEVLNGSANKPALADGGTLGVEAGKDLGAVFAEGSSALQLLKENLANLKVLTSAMAKQNQMESIMHDLTETSANLKEITHQFRSSNAMSELGNTMKNFRIVSEKVKNGEGTIGALMTDASLYEDLKNLIGGANRNNVLKFFVRQAVKSSDDAAAKREDGAKENGKKIKPPGPASVPK
ncbi:MAG TPA: MlaD family protein [Bdellovibrionota bacterium]|jgi:phospholipid/cholesterol/gamma-HCH transport system substrate-binding protein